MSSDSFDQTTRGLLDPSRRRFVQGLTAGGAIAALGFWPRYSWAVKAQGVPNILSGTEFDLDHRRNPDEFHWAYASGDHRQRLHAGADAALAGRRRR